MSRKIGLVLSGGGVRAVAHAGVLQALIEADMRPDYISGTSAGAIVGAMYAVGCSVEEIVFLFEKEKLFSASNLTFRKLGLGLVDTAKIGGMLHKYMGDKYFRDLKLRLFVAATNLLTGRLKVFDTGPLVPAVLASASFPFVFTPTKVDGELYIDGGILNNFPVEPLLGICDLTIGVNVSPLDRINRKDIDGYLSLSNRIMDLAINTSSQQKIHLCDLIINPPELGDIGTFDSEDVPRAYQIGYDHARAALQNL